MGRDELALDTVLAGAQFWACEWSPDLIRTRAPYLLRFLLCRWYDAGRGRVGKSPVKLSQGTLARKLGISRQWCAILLGRLRDAGWLDYYAVLLPDGMRGSCVISAGRQLQRMLVMLAKSRRGKSPAKPPVTSRWKFSPLEREKILSAIREKENQPPPAHILRQMPLLSRWLERGDTTIA
jgi:hypothetical protein